MPTPEELKRQNIDALLQENIPDFLRGNLSGKLPFLYESTGIETHFGDECDPEPRSRRVFAFHRPETLGQWFNQLDHLRRRLARGKTLTACAFAYRLIKHAGAQPRRRGTPVLSPTGLQAVSGIEAQPKTHLVIIDAVGVCESDKTDSRPLNRKPTEKLENILLGVASRESENSQHKI